MRINRKFKIISIPLFIILLFLLINNQEITLSSDIKTNFLEVPSVRINIEPMIKVNILKSVLTDRSEFFFYHFDLKF